MKFVNLYLIPLFGIICSLFTLGKAATIEEIHDARAKLHEQLYGEDSSYDTKLLPISPSSIRWFPDKPGVTAVSFAVILNELGEFDSNLGTLSPNVWIYMFWEDTRLSWEISLHKNIKTLYVNPEDISVPQIRIWNGRESINFFPDDGTNKISLTHEGKLSWMFPATLTSTHRVKKMIII